MYIDGETIVVETIVVETIVVDSRNHYYVQTIVVDSGDEKLIHSNRLPLFIENF